VIQVIEWSGGMSTEDREALSLRAMWQALQTLEMQYDKSAYCESIPDQMEAGSLDLDRLAATGPAAARILAAKLD
jgi:hypothetical protein